MTTACSQAGEKKCAKKKKHRVKYAHTDPVAPVAYQVILEPGIGQFVSSSPAECILV